MDSPVKSYLASLFWVLFLLASLEPSSLHFHIPVVSTKSSVVLLSWSHLQ